jgi:hypothetical protein
MLDEITCPKEALLTGSWALWETDVLTSPGHIYPN